MGWLDYHLHEFEVNNSQRIEIPDEEGGYNILPGWKVPISSYLTLSNKQMIYEYDFGDLWRHKIVLEKILSIEPNVKYPRCLAGERACPPEDCGGIW